MALELAECEDCRTLIPKRHWRQKICSDCARERKRAQDRRYYAANTDRVKATVRRYAEANRGHINLKQKAARKADPEAARAEGVRRYKRDAEKRKREARDWYHKNRERVLARMSTDEGRAASRERMRERLKDPHLRLHANISHAIRTSLADKRRRPWEHLVGYSVEELAHHLERQFQKGMTWENMGRGRDRWHIDHIVPRIAFHYEDTDHEAFRACWALTNLRPLWSTENISKHAKRTHLL